MELVFMALRNLMIYEENTTFVEKGELILITNVENYDNKVTLETAKQFHSGRFNLGITSEHVEFIGVLWHNLY